MSSLLHFTQDGLPDQAIELLAELLLAGSGTGSECELCGEYPAEFFIDQHQHWAGRHVCRICFGNLCDQTSEDESDGSEAETA